MKRIMRALLMACFLTAACSISAIAAENVDLKSQTEYQAYTLPEDLLVTFTNKNSVDVTFKGNVTYYNSNGEMISSDESYVWDAPANGECVMYLDLPEDANYKTVAFDHYTFDYTVEDAKKNFDRTNYAKQITVESNTSSSGGVVAKFVNNTGKKLDEVGTIIVYYKGTEAVGFSVDMIWGLDSEVSKEYAPPKDEDYHNIEYDTYKIFINSTVIYS